jgi:flagellar hook-associated protein 2
MAVSSVSGLASGVDTSSLVSQLIAVERNSQTLLKNRLSTEQSNVSSLQGLNSKLASLATAAEKLTKADGWSTVKATSSSDKVTATATSATTPGAISFTVDRLATAHTVGFANEARMSDVVVDGETVPRTVALTIGGKTTDIDAGDGTLAGLVSGINAAGTGVKAGLVKVGQDDDGKDVFRLRVTSATTGEAARFSLDDSVLALGTASTLTEGSDAELTVGGDIRVTSASNTFSGVFNGLDVTLRPGSEKTTVDLTIESDTAAKVKSVKELVDSVNSIISAMDSATAYSTGSTRNGTLAGDTQVRSVRNALLESVYPADGTSMAGLGIQTDRYGKLVLDEAKLTSALEADPAKVAAAFTAGTSAGFAERVRSVARGASDSVDGTITAAINGRKSTIDRLETSIEDWDRRLVLRQQTLTRQFTAMETTLNSLNSQSNWLSSQISSLSSGRDK